ncbi:adenine nucleotide alpha hydrolase [Roseovarius sp.]|uniref:adenine nucleotide alpha hydrolase n=1 Tax=Roseovarius sp. TaxID=1486281 RepID=UPI003564C668
MGRGGSNLARLSKVLEGHRRLVFAVSGGVDSMTLTHVAHQALRRSEVRVFHAVSPAVPQAATERVKSHAAQSGWALTILNAGEFADPNYLKNPVNRCYFCKSNLYDRIREATSDTIASGANLDDLGDYRPGLLAAKERSVVHPFIEAQFSKEDIRALAREFGLDDISALPAQPCMASRIETGITVDPGDLKLVEDLEQIILAHAPGVTVRCRIVAGGVRLELSEGPQIDKELRDELVKLARRKCGQFGKTLLGVAPYRRGSAFLHDA